MSNNNVHFTPRIHHERILDTSNGFVLTWTDITYP